MRDNRFPTIVTRRADLGASLTETMREARRLYEITPCKIAKPGGATAPGRERHRIWGEHLQRRSQARPGTPSPVQSYMRSGSMRCHSHAFASRSNFSARFGGVFGAFLQPIFEIFGDPLAIRMGPVLVETREGVCAPPPAPCGAHGGGWGKTGPGTDGIIPAPGLPAQTYEDCRRWSASRAGRLGRDDWR
jgi:hypothetical protein